MKINFEKIFFVYKVVVLLVAFIFVSNFIAWQSGITDSVSDIFMDGSGGVVAGEFEVQMAQSGTVLGISGDKFTINGSETFLLGVSAFDSLGKIQDSDLDYLAANNYNLIRIWLYWRDLNVAYDSNGYLLPNKESQLIDLVQRAGARGIVVDVTALFLYEGYSYPSFGTDVEEMKHAVSSVAKALDGHNNVLIDVMNEHNHDGNVNQSHQVIASLISEVKNEDPDRIVTVSSTGKHIINSSGSLETTNINEELSAGIDVMTPHLYRSSDWYSQTDDRVELLKNYIASQSGGDIPVYLQEPNYYPENGTLNQMVEAATLAKQAGAAAWLFHQIAGFNLSSDSFENNLLDLTNSDDNTNGQDVLEAIGRAISSGGGSCTVGNSCTTSLSCPGTYSATCSCVDVVGDSCPSGGGSCAVQTITDSWSPSNESDYLEFSICDSVDSGYVEFTVDNIAKSNMEGKKPYVIGSVLDKSTTDKDSQNPNYAYFDILGYGYPAEYAGKVHYRANVNNDCNIGDDCRLLGDRCSDDSDYPDDLCPAAWENEFYTDFAYGPWEGKSHTFRIDWGSGANGSHLVYSYWDEDSWRVLKDWDAGQISDPNYHNFSWSADGMVLRLGANTIYGAIPGAIYSNIKVKTSDGTTPPPSCTPGDSCSPASDGCPRVCSSSGICVDVAGDNCPAGGGEPVGGGDLIKVAEGAKNPAVAVDGSGNLHFAYDCHNKSHSKGVSAGGVCYRSVYSDRGTIMMSDEIDLLSDDEVELTGDPRIEMDGLDNVHIVAGSSYVVITPGGDVIKRDFSGIDSPRLAVNKTTNESYMLYREGRYGGIMLRKLNFDGSSINEEWMMTVNAACSKPQMPGNVVIDNSNQVSVTWRQYGDGDAICPGRNVQFADINESSQTKASQTEVFGSTSDFSDVRYDILNDEYHLIAVSPYADTGLLYRRMASNGSLSSVYTIYDEAFLAGAAVRFGEGNSVGPYLSFDSLGELYMSFIGVGDDIKLETKDDAKREAYWEAYEKIRDYPSFVPSESQLLEARDVWLANNSGKTEADYIAMLNREATGCWANNSATEPRGCEYYTAYYTVLDISQLNPSGNNHPEVFRFTPDRDRESDQGTAGSNPLIGPAWNQGVFFSYEDDYENPLFDVYLKAAGGAVIGMPVLAADFNCSGKVDIQDFGILLSHWEKSGDYLAHYVHASCGGEEKNLNLDNITPVSVSATDFGPLLGCWYVPGQVLPDTCFVYD